MAIQRIWHGWTTPQNADNYQRLLLDEVIPGIAAKNIPGYRGIEVLRRDVTDGAADAAEVEFVTLMTFDSLDSIIAFQGQDYTRSYVPAAAQKVLSRWDDHAQHYEVVSVRSRSS